MGDVLLPILKDTKDPHYRYKMPKLNAKVEGSGNGIKTVITNMDAIAKALGRPPAYPTKYFGCELGAQVTMNNEIYVVNGSHDPEKLLNLLYSFIQKFVLCPKCKNPETRLSVSGQNIRQKCIACGNENTINKSIHKLTTYIINHPVNGVSNTNVKGKSSKKSKKHATGNSSPTNGQPVANGDSGNDNTALKENDDAADEDEFDDDELTSAAYQERMRELCEGLNNDMYMSDTKENANIFYELVKEKKEAQQLGDSNVQKELVAEAERLKIKDKATLILSELLFTENIVDEIKTHRLLFLRFCYENKKAQKYLLGGFEKLVGDVYKDVLFNSVCRILKQFYDEDILEEEALIEWSKKESKKYVSRETSKQLHEKAAPFIKWLKEAEVEEDSDDDEEEDEEDSKKSTAAKAGSNGKKVNGSTNKGIRHHSVSDDEDDDDGIDLEFSHRVSGMHITAVEPVETPKAVNADVVAANGEEQVDEDLDIDNI